VNPRDFISRPLVCTPPEPPAAEGAPVLATPGLSIRSNFMWVLAGNAVFAVCQWGVIVALAKFGTTTMVGQFSLGLAVATPVLMFTNLYLRAVQATDARRIFHFTDYLRLRMILTAAGLVVIAAIAGCGRHRGSTLAVILALALAKGIETLSDIYYGLFQLNDRLDQTGRSLILRGVSSVVAFSVVLYCTRNVVWGCSALVLVWLAALLFFDVRHGRRFTVIRRQATNLRRQWTLARLALPLGIVTALAALNLNMPRYFIYAWLGDRQLGIYSAMAYATVGLTLVNDSLSHTVIPRLARLYAGGQIQDFRALLGTFFAVSLALGLVGLTCVEVAGRPLLRIFYNPEYAAQAEVFTLLVAAAAIHCIASVLTSAITSARHFRIQVPLYGSAVLGNALACSLWVPRFGLAGGALALIVSASLQLVFGAAVLGFHVLAADGRGEVLQPAPINRCEPEV
jgi:O-antigen/teichoic acid export membrane protein